jgi:hypothetical protein
MFLFFDGLHQFLETPCSQIQLNMRLEFVSSSNHYNKPRVEICHKMVL